MKKKWLWMENILQRKEKFNWQIINDEMSMDYTILRIVNSVQNSLYNKFVFNSIYQCTIIS
jgi:hypothetical protein